MKHVLNFIKSLFLNITGKAVEEYSEKGYCPIYAKDNVKRLYKPYTELGVDDVITELVGKLLQMPTEKH